MWHVAKALVVASALSAALAGCLALDPVRLGPLVLQGGSVEVKPSGSSSTSPPLQPSDLKATGS